MSEIRSIGLTSIKIGDIAEDGGMGQTLSPLGVTFQDTAELVRDDPEITEIYSEENDEPEEVVEVKGAARVRWKIMNIDPSFPKEPMTRVCTPSICPICTRQASSVHAPDC